MKTRKNMFLCWLVATGLAASQMAYALDMQSPWFPDGHQAVALLDAAKGLDANTGSGVVLHVSKGAAVALSGPEGAQSHAFADAEAVEVEIQNLSAGREYALGLEWFDADSQGRSQSVSLRAPWGQSINILPPGPAAAFYEGKPISATLVFPIPPKFTEQGGRVVLKVRKHAGPNAVLQAVCLLEKTNTDKKKRLLILTGDDYPGHLWRQTALALAEVLREEPAFEVSVSEAPAFLGSPLLAYYDAVVIHFKNYAEQLPLGAVIGESLKAYAGNGGGLMLIHFACGAFQEWDGFAQVAGRIWNPALRAHDPYGDFKVAIVDQAHPVTRGLEDFTTTDELYTCLDGATPIHILCEAVSSVDGKTYPIAFALKDSPARVLHSVLGHDVQAYQSKGARTLLQNAARWVTRMSG